MRTTALVLWSGAAIILLVFAGAPQSGAGKAGVCQGLNTHDCTLKLVYGIAPWDSADYRRWSIAVVAAKWDTTTADCSGAMADTVTMARNGVRMAIANWYTKTRPPWIQKSILTGPT